MTSDVVQSLCYAPPLAIEVAIRSSFVWTASGQMDPVSVALAAFVMILDSIAA